MNVGDTFRVTADSYGYSLTRLRQVKRRNGDTVQEYGDPTFHRDLASVRRRVAEYAMREAVAASADLASAVAAFEAAIDRIVLVVGEGVMREQETRDERSLATTPTASPAGASTGGES